MQALDHISQLQVAWETLVTATTYRHTHFFLTNKWLLLKYKSLQYTCPLLIQIQDTLWAKIDSLKNDLQLDNSPALLVEYAHLASLLRNIKIREAQKWHCNSSMKWALLGDSSPKFFFAAIQEQGQHTKITQFSLDSGDCITWETEIMVELERFYQALFSKGFTTLHSSNRPSKPFSTQSYQFYPSKRSKTLRGYLHYLNSIKPLNLWPKEKPQI